VYRVKALPLKPYLVFYSKNNYIIDGVRRFQMATEGDNPISQSR
jgi:hypothetical protein